MLTPNHFSNQPPLTKSHRYYRDAFELLTVIPGREKSALFRSPSRNQFKIANGVWTPLATKGDARPL